VRVLIAGGGTGGLAAAIALRRAGLDPLVLERAPAFTAIGAGLGLQVNAMKALTYLGADECWRRNAARLDVAEQRGLQADDLVTAAPYDAQVAAYGEHYYCGHRADLMASLLSVLPPGCVRTGSAVVGVTETSSDVRVRLEDGEELSGDLLVGADGLRSQVRTLLFGEQEARFTGVVVWRGLIDRAKVPGRYDAKIITWLGPSRHVLLYPLRPAGHPASVYSLSAFVPAGEVRRESWTASGDLADLRASLAQASPAMQELLDGVGEALITGIYFRDPLPRWGTGRVVLLGDAAHPAPPSAGQGAGMALEDAVMLAACLRRHGRGDVPAALGEYAFRRGPRTVRMLESSRVNLRNSQPADPVQVRARNGYYRGLRRLSPAAPPMARWLLSHDPVAAAEQSAAEFAASLAAPGNPMIRPEARRAFDAWRGALTPEDRAAGWLGERAGYEKFLRGLTAGADTRGLGVDCDGVPAVLVGEPGPPGSPAVLHLHGGGYVMGSAQLTVPLAGKLAAAIGGPVLVPDYRLAPEHPFPAALDDALTACRWLAREYPQAPVLVSGECAGGGLAVALAVALRDAGDRLPAGSHALSPFADLTVSAASPSLEASSDPWFDQVFLTQLAACYLHDTDPDQPLASPLSAGLSGLPPLLIYTAAGELLAGQAQRLAATAQAAGVEVTLRLVEDSVHSFVLFDDLPEARQALEDFAAFARDVRPG
jgi:salicylate hydroxylase